MFSLYFLEPGNQRSISHFRCLRCRFWHIGFLLRCPFQFRVLQLFTDSHTMTGPHEFGQIYIKGMVRESRQLDTTVNAALPTGQGNAEYLGSLHSILAENFIEISDTEQQYCIGMFLFHLPILLQQRLIFLLNLLGDRLFFRRFCLYLLLWLRCRSRLYRVRGGRLDTVGIIQFQIKTQTQRVIERSPQITGYTVNTTFMLIDDSRFAVWISTNLRIGADNILRECQQIFVARHLRTTVNNRLNEKFLVSR